MQAISMLNVNVGSMKAVTRNDRVVYEVDCFVTGLEQLNNSCNFYKGTLKNGQTLEMPGSVIIMGDVYPEATIIAKKNIIVLGGLYGHAHAGVGGESCFVAALDMNPQSIKIDEIKGSYER